MVDLRDLDFDDLLDEALRLEEENEELEAQLTSLIQFTGNLPWVKSELQRRKDEQEYFSGLSSLDK